MPTEAARQVVMELCGEILGASPRSWSQELLDELAARVDEVYLHEAPEKIPLRAAS